MRSGTRCWLLQMNETRRRYLSYPPARSSLASPLPAGPCLPPVSRPRTLAFLVLKRFLQDNTADIFFNNIVLLFFYSTTHQRASHDLLHCIRRYAHSSEARKVTIGMSATFSSLRRLHPPKDDNHINVFFSQLIRP